MENENLKNQDKWQPYKEYMEKRPYSKGGRLYIEDADMLNYQVNRLREETRRQRSAEKDGEATVAFDTDDGGTCTTEPRECDYSYDFLGRWPLARRYVNLFGDRSLFTEGSGSAFSEVPSRLFYNGGHKWYLTGMGDKMDLRASQSVRGFVGARPCGMKIESVVREGNDYRISDFIKDLERLKNSYGDLPCIMRANDGGGSIRERMMAHIGKENLIVPDENLAKTLGVECRKSPVCEKRGFQIALGFVV